VLVSTFQETVAVKPVSLLSVTVAHCSEYESHTVRFIVEGQLREITGFSVSGVTTIASTLYV
jgi:hypothetical protein